MVKAQEFLDQNYPKEKRGKISEIYLNEPSLEGELDLEEFTYENYKYDGEKIGVKVLISLLVDEKKLDLKMFRIVDFQILEIQFSKMFPN